MKRLGLTLSFVIAAGAGVIAASAPASTATSHRLAIVHVQTGCHSWSRAGKTSASLTVTVKRGASLMIMNHDIDAHRLLQTAGPKLHLPGTMMMSHSGSIAFPQKGVYRFVTKIVEMPGMPEVETMGPDNVLRLTVRVT